MSGVQSPTYIFDLVHIAEAERAFAFHKRIASNNSHIWPRKLDDVEKMAHDDSLYGAHSVASKEYVALCYALPDENEKEWELGGLIVDPPLKRIGIAAVLARYALASTMIQAEPWKYGQEVIAYVHEANDEPRQLLKSLGFEYSGTYTVPEEKAPPDMKRDADGKLVGDKFVFTPAGLTDLSRWFDTTFDGTLDHGNAIAEIKASGIMSLESMKELLREMARGRG